MSRTFYLGKIVTTHGALAACVACGVDPFSFVHRHMKGDWGDLSAEDRAANERALEDGSRIFSVYYLPDQTKIWVITEATGDDEKHRASTCIMLPSDY